MVKKSWLLFLVVSLALFSSCAVRIVPASSTPATPAPAPSNRTVINARLDLNAYPGSQILDFDNDKNGSSKLRFTVSANLETVNAHFHREISLRGRQRTRFELKSQATKIEARYARQGANFKYKLDREGNSNRFKLEIDFDDDDDDDD